MQWNEMKRKENSKFTQTNPNRNITKTAHTYTQIVGIEMRIIFVIR